MCHLLFSGFSICCYALYHLIYTRLSLLEFALLSFFHVQFDGLSSFYSKVVLNHLDILIDLGYLLLRIDQNQL